MHTLPSPNSNNKLNVLLYRVHLWEFINYVFLSDMSQQELEDLQLAQALAASEREARTSQRNNSVSVVTTA